MSGILHLARNDAIEARCMRVVRRCLELGAVRSLCRDTRFDADLAADSLNMVTIAMAIEEEFGVEINDDEEASVRTVGEMVDIVREKLA